MDQLLTYLLTYLLTTTTLLLPTCYLLLTLYHLLTAEPGPAVHCWYHFHHTACITPVRHPCPGEHRACPLLITRVQASIDQLVAQSIDTLVQSVDAQLLGDVCPPNALPADKAMWGSGLVRVVNVGGLGCPCGGTHVANTSELRAVTVSAIKSKGKVTRVSYTVLTTQ